MSADPAGDLLVRYLAPLDGGFGFAAHHVHQNLARAFHRPAFIDGAGAQPGVEVVARHDVKVEQLVNVGDALALLADRFRLAGLLGDQVIALHPGNIHHGGGIGGLNRFHVISHGLGSIRAIDTHRRIGGNGYDGRLQQRPPGYPDGVAIGGFFPPVYRVADGDVLQEPFLHILEDFLGAAVVGKAQQATQLAVLEADVVHDADGLLVVMTEQQRQAIDGAA